MDEFGTAARINKLLAAAKKWDPEWHGYICQEFSGNVCFSNDLDCDGYAYWSARTFLKFVEQNGLTFEPEKADIWDKISADMK